MWCATDLLRIYLQPMKNRSSRRLAFGYLSLAGTCFFSPCFAQSGADSLLKRCATEQAEELRSRNDASRRADQQHIEQLIQEHISRDNSNLRLTAEVIRIPVVVHVVHNQADNRIGGAGNTNISEEQIRSQITVLNQDYRRIAGTNGFNTNPVGVDAQIEFELAPYDPSGHKVDGITRTYTKITDFNAYTDDKVLSDIISWPSDKYLNIWVCPFQFGFLGVSQLPSAQNIAGLDNSKKDEAKTDGVIIDYRAFGSVQYMADKGPITSNTYNLGRTTTHEVGHWLGLFHPWGKVENVCGTDYCDDTPPAKSGNLSLVCDPREVECAGVTSQVMIENYMDYSPDRCMNIFTKNQLDRMDAVLAVSPRRAALVAASKEGRLESSDNLTVEVFPNPSIGEIFAKIRFASFQSFSASVYNQSGILMSTTNFRDVWSRKIPINTDRLNPGMYILKVSTGQETVSKRFVIN